MSDAAKPLLRLGGILVPLLILCALPLYLEAYWLRIGLFSMAAAIGAIGLSLLSGTAGQLSMGHAFFLAVGAYGYVWFSGDPGLGLPPVIAMVLAVLLAGAAGGVFSPVAGRVKGMYLGIATLALVFIGHHLMLTMDGVTGGFNGRSVEPMEIGGLVLDSGHDDLGLFGVPFGAEERLWYFGLVLLAFTWFTARGLLRGRPGRALVALRDSETAASVMGVPVARYRSSAFVVSSMYAGLAGVLLALSFRRVVPDYFGLVLSIDYLAMIVIGGLGSVAGAVAGAFFVTALPLVMAKYADQLPLVAAPGSPDGSLGPTEAARYLYGAAIVVILLWAPDGLHGLVRRLRLRLRRKPSAPPHDTGLAEPVTTAPSAVPVVTVKEHTP
ncbi:branched-chain amino acid ABC transporter permease [Streptomyces sp. NPDC002644]